MAWELNAARIADIEAYKVVRDGVGSMKESVDLGRFLLDLEETSDIIKAVMNDHPLFIHFEGGWRYSECGGRVERIFPVYTMNERERRISVQEIKSRCAEIVAPCMDMEPIDREMYVLDWIRSNVVWERTGRSSDHSPAGALFGGRCVCDGISKATSLLMNAAEVECCVVSDGGHSWNVVRIGGRCGHLDAGTVCWSHPSSRQSMINVSDEEAYGLDLGCEGCDRYRLSGLYADGPDSLNKILMDH